MSAERGGAESGVAFGLPDITPDDEAAVLRVLRSRWLSTGAECAALESDLRAVCGAEHVVTTSSCTAALELALAHLHLPPGSNVGVPTWTFVATAEAVVRTGGRPVLLDVDGDTLNLDPTSLERAIGDLAAVVPVHFGGLPVNRRVHEVCDAHGLPVVEDAAHALGATDHRGPLGSGSRWGTCFSFYATKNVTAGEGGALATDDPDLAATARTLRNHGLTADAWRRSDPDGPADYDVAEIGTKANLADILAALARSQLRRLDSMGAHRLALVGRYHQLISPIGGLRILPGSPSAGSANHLLVVALPPGVDRDAVRAQMKRAGVATGVQFRPLHTMTWFRGHAATGRGGVPTADSLAGRVMSLPLHPGLNDDDVNRVCESLTDALTAASSGTTR